MVVKCCSFGGIACRKLPVCVTRSSRHTMPLWCRLATRIQVASNCCSNPPLQCAFFCSHSIQNVTAQQRSMGLWCMTLYRYWTVFL